MAGLSLLLWIATAALWLRAYYSLDQISVFVRWSSSGQIKNYPALNRFNGRITYVSANNLTGAEIDLANLSGALALQLAYVDEPRPHKSDAQGPRVQFKSRHMDAARRVWFLGYGRNPHGVGERYGANANVDSSGIHDVTMVYIYAVSDWLLLLIFFPLTGVVAHRPISNAPQTSGMLLRLRLRPPRHPRPLPRMRNRTNPHRNLAPRNLNGRSVRAQTGSVAYPFSVHSAFCRHPSAFVPPPFHSAPGVIHSPFGVLL